MKLLCSNPFRDQIHVEILQRKELNLIENRKQVIDLYKLFKLNKIYYFILLIDKDEYYHQPRVRRPSIVIREHQLSQYPVNYDPSPHIIRKKVDDHHEPIVYKQQIAVRYLCPPTPPPPAPLIIREIRQPEPEALPPSNIKK
jgi:hypothetical protein